MARDNINHIVIKEYVKSKGFLGTENSIEYFIKQLLKNNFNIILHRGSFEKSIEVPGLITIKRNDLLKFITHYRIRLILHIIILQSFFGREKAYPYVR